MNISKVTLVGFLQALGLVIYCALIASLIWKIGGLMDGSPGITGIILWLFLLALSAATCGLLVFGYPTYLVVTQKKIREALYILLYTLLFCVGISGVLIVVIFSLS